MRFRLSTLMIALALGPPLLAVAWWMRGRHIGTFDLRALVATVVLALLVVAAMRIHSATTVGLVLQMVIIYGLAFASFFELLVVLASISA